jgi:hypothetical protein
MISPSFAWKLVLALALAATIFASARAEAPRRSFPRTELRWLVGSALLLYAVGLAASLSHHGLTAALLYAGGIAVSALAGWLSRGADSGGRPPFDEPADQPPPPSPDGAPRFDWARFEREFRVYDRRRGRRGTPVA